MTSFDPTMAVHWNIFIFICLHWMICLMEVSAKSTPKQCVINQLGSSGHCESSQTWQTQANSNCTQSDKVLESYEVRMVCSQEKYRFVRYGCCTKNTGEKSYTFTNCKLLNKTTACLTPEKQIDQSLSNCSTNVTNYQSSKECTDTGTYTFIRFFCCSIGTIATTESHTSETTQETTEDPKVATKNGDSIDYGVIGVFVVALVIICVAIGLYVYKDKRRSRASGKDSIDDLQTTSLDHFTKGNTELNKGKSYKAAGPSTETITTASEMTETNLYDEIATDSASVSQSVSHSASVNKRKKRSSKGAPDKHDDPRTAMTTTRGRRKRSPGDQEKTELPDQTQKSRRRRGEPSDDDNSEIPKTSRKRRKSSHNDQSQSLRTKRSSKRSTKTDDDSDTSENPFTSRTKRSRRNR